jgi:hypothetical protein
MLLSIDPGVTSCGVAAWDNEGRLVRAELVQGDTWQKTVQGIVDTSLNNHPDLAIEKPQVYTQNKLKGDPNDLIDLAVVVGAIVGVFGLTTRVTLYRPSEWKGQTPKDVMIDRIKNKLSKAEHKKVELPKAKSLQHNVWDAVGIGLYHERRKRSK